MVERSCTACGAAVPAGAAFCTNCGAQVADQPAAAPNLPAPPTEVVRPKNDDRNRLYALIAIGIAVVLVGGALVATSGGKDSGPGTAAGEVFLEPADSVGEAPFTESVDTNTAPPPVQLVGASSSPSVSGSPSPPGSPSPSGPEAVGVRSVQGAAPGLYGGTQNESACDAARMVEFLTEQPAKARAWAAVHGIAPEDIPAFVSSLTPIVLRADTRVTNHGYRDGRATPFQAVLQAGTAVLVDDLGIPRVKCGCGNPLAQPEAQTQGVRYTGPRWPTFRPRNVIVIVNTNVVRVKNFVLVDLVRPGFFVRPVGIPAPGAAPADGAILIDTFCDLYPQECRPPELEPGGPVPEPRPGEPALGTGDVQVTLRWSSTADLDLAVIDPNGEAVNFDSPTSSSGGQLDVDSNASCNELTSTPVENIFWPPGQSPDGDYTIIVSYYGECPGGAGPQTFELTVLMGGVAVDVQTVSFGPEDATIELLVERFATRVELRPLATTGTLNAPGDTVTGLVSKEGGPAAGLPPGKPTMLSASPPLDESSADPLWPYVPGSLYVIWGPASEFPPEVGIEDAYEVTVEPGGETFLIPASTSWITIPGLEPGVQYTFTVVAVNSAGKGPPATVTGTPEGPPPEETPPAGETGAQEPPPETLQEYCNRLYGPPPEPFEVNMEWTLCMHDPTSDDAVDPRSVPQPIEVGA